MIKKSLAVGIIFFLVISSVPYSTLSNKISTSTFGGNTLYVGGTGPGNYSKIQDAIDNASDGDTIYVYSDSYYENLVIDNSINLIGEDRETTIIDGSGSGYVLQISANWINISGFTIRNSRSGRSGIYLKSNHSHIFDNNIILNYGSGIEIFSIPSGSSYNHYILDNYISCLNDNTGNGISLMQPDSTTITGNTVTNNSLAGIQVYHSDDNTITNNIISNNGHGVELLSSHDNSVSGNQFVNNGILASGQELSHFIHEIDITNTVNNKPIYYFKNMNSFTVPAEAGQILLVNCDEVNVENTVLTHADVGILMYQSSNIIIKNSDISLNNGNGILIEKSNNITLLNNCILSNNGSGIEISSVPPGSSNNNNIFDNNISSNNVYGIHLMQPSYTTVMNNTISNNSNVGIRLYSSSNNLIYHNNFFENSQNAYDANNGNNQWDNGAEGNYWDDYSGVDANSDGIGDSPYNISSGDNQDRYPLMKPYLGPGVDADISGGFGLTVIIENVGDVTCTNLTVDVSIDGGMLVLNRHLSSETILILNPGDEVTLDFFLFGFGKVSITVIAGGGFWKWELPSFMFGPFVFIQDN